MTATAESYMIAAGWNVGQGSLVNIENITPPGDEAFAGPKGLPLYNNGTIKVRGDGTIYLTGYPLVTWLFTRLTYAQWAYLSSTYCASGLSGKVTIYTTLGTSTYVRMNAVMILPKPADVRSEYRYQEASIRFTRLAAAS